MDLIRSKIEDDVSPSGKYVIHSRQSTPQTPVNHILEGRKTVMERRKQPKELRRDAKCDWW